MRFGQKRESSSPKSSYLLTKKTMTWTLDPLPSYKFVILSSELERMKLTQPPPTFLLDVTLFTFFFLNSSLSHCQAQPQLNSTQFQLQLRLSWFYFHLIQQPTHPQEKFQLKLEMSQIKRDWFKTTLGLLQANLYKTSNWLKNTLTLRTLQCLKMWFYQLEFIY